MMRTSLSRREFLRLSAAGAIGAALVACQPVAAPPAAPSAAEGEKKEGQAPAKVEEPVEIVFVNTASTDSSEQLYRPIYEKFREAHPDIKVTEITV